MDEKKLKFIILKELEKGNTKLSPDNLETDVDTLIRVTKVLQDEKLISGVEYFHSPRVVFSDAHLTSRGGVY